MLYHCIPWYAMVYRTMVCYNITPLSLPLSVPLPLSLLPANEISSVSADWSIVVVGVGGGVRSF